MLRAGSRASAAIEFALVAPVAATMAVGAVDIARATIVWEQTCNSAREIAASAEKLSYTSGSSATSLTSTQMQSAMSTIYAAVPGLSVGNGTSTTASSFVVTLSGVVFSPTCSTSSGCAAQTPYTSWSSYLSQTGVTPSTAPLRACGALTTVTAFPDDDTQLTKMVSWSVAAGTGKIPLPPQVVADVRVTYVPIFSVFLGPVVFWASSAMPAPIGATDQVVAFNTTAPTGNVETCTVP